MKIMITALLAIAGLFPTVVHAASEELWDALQVQSQDVRPTDGHGVPSLGAHIDRKRIAGLTCIRTNVVVPGAKAQVDCQLNTGAMTESGAQDIYQALDITPVDGRLRDAHGMPSLGANIDKKAVGDFACLKIKVLTAATRYECRVQF